MADDYGGALERLITGGDDYGAVSLPCCCGWHRIVVLCLFFVAVAFVFYSTCVTTPEKNVTITEFP